MSGLALAERLRKLEPKNVIEMLKASSWVDNGPYGPFGQRFALETGSKEYRVIVPTKKGVGDFALRMLEVVEAVAAVRQQDRSEVIEQLENPPARSVRERKTAKQTLTPRPFQYLDEEKPIEDTTGFSMPGTAKRGRRNKAA